MKKNPLNDIIDQVLKIAEEAPAIIDKRRHQSDAKQIEAIGRLIQTITQLDKQNKKLEITNIGLQKAAIFLAAVALSFTVFQAIDNIYISFVLSTCVTAVVYIWFIRGK